MEAKDFIIDHLNKISENISGISLRYAYDEITEFHIIEVSPESIRGGDASYVRMACDLWDSFHERFPDEDLLISDVDETNDMSNLLYENKSDRFDNHSKFSYLYYYTTDTVIDNNCNYNFNIAA